MQIPKFPYRLNVWTCMKLFEKSVIQEICGEFLNLRKVINSLKTKFLEKNIQEICGGFLNLWKVMSS